MNGRKRNIWGALRSINIQKPADAPEDTYPKGKAKYTRAEPDAAFDRQQNSYIFNHHERRYKPSTISERETFQYS